MVFRTVVVCALAGVATACGGPEVTYNFDPVRNGALPDRSVRVTVQATTIALGTSATGAKDTTATTGPGVGGGNAPGAQGARGASPAGAPGAGSVAATGCGAKGDWKACVQGVSAVPALVASEEAGAVETAPKRTFVATPRSRWWAIADTYSLVSAPVGDDERLPKAITVTWTDNVKTIVATTGTGAATGFLFGPIGGAVGAAVGLGVGVVTAEGGNLNVVLVDRLKRLQEASAAPRFSDFVCSVDKNPTDNSDIIAVLNYDNIPTAKLMPQLQLPVVLKPGPSADFFDPDSPNNNYFWHPVPNNVAAMIGPAATNPDHPQRDPQQGDGWFYRIVIKHEEKPESVDRKADRANKADRAKLLAGPTQTDLWFETAKKAPVDLFPVATCEKATVQLTWWKEIADHAGDSNPLVWHQKVVIADPDLITPVKIPRSGTINFRLGCGAYATNSFAATPEADRITQLDTMVQTVLKAQTSSQAAPPKASTPPQKTGK